MRLTPISDHAGADFRRFYLELADNPGWSQCGIMMARLVEHLGTDVAGPDCWAFTSHASLVLSDRDTYKKALVTVNANVRNYAPQGYEITHRVNAPWSRVIGYTEDVEVAGAMIMEALERAARDRAEATG